MKVKNRAEPRFSIIIPTLLTSAKFAEYNIKLLLSSERQDFEIILSLNPSINWKSLKLNFKDRRLKVISPNLSLSMNQHYEFALKAARGEWVQIIGADDFVTNYYFEDLERVLSDFPDVQIINWQRAYYFWNSPVIISRVQFEYLKKDGVSKKNMRLRTITSFLGFISMFELPQLYTCSIVKRDLIKLIRLRSEGCFYHSLIPDIYSSVALAAMKPIVYRSNKPLTWVGTSSASYGKEGRIYSDSNKHSLCSRHNHNELHGSISSDAHKMEVEAIYLLEAMNQYEVITKQRLRIWRLCLVTSIFCELFLPHPKDSNLVKRHLVSILKDQWKVSFLCAFFIIPVILSRLVWKEILRIKYYLEVKFQLRAIRNNIYPASPSEANKSLDSDLRSAR
jgi:hypothetical protein